MTEQFDVVAWMAEHGHTGYAERIHDEQCFISETLGEAGRYGAFCPFTQEIIRKAEARIEEIRREAYNRWDDWRTDALP